MGLTSSTSAQIAADGTVTVFTAFLSEARSTSKGLMAIVMMPLWAIWGGATDLALARALLEAPTPATVTLVLLLNLAVVSFVAFMWRWVTRGGTVLVADADGIAYGLSIGGLSRSVQQRPRWGQVTAIDVVEGPTQTSLVYASSYGSTPFGHGLSLQQAQEVRDAMLRLKAGGR